MIKLQDYFNGKKSLEDCQDLMRLVNERLDNSDKGHNLASNEVFPGWFFHQALQAMGHLPVIMKDDKVSLLETFKSWNSTPDAKVGGLRMPVVLAALRLIVGAPRSKFFPVRYPVPKTLAAKDYAEYSPFTPPLLLAIREQQGIPYSAWDNFDKHIGSCPNRGITYREGLSEVVSKYKLVRYIAGSFQLEPALVCLPTKESWIPMSDIEEVKEGRILSLTYKTGGKRGQTRELTNNTVSEHTHREVSLSTYTVQMVFQTYLAHPSLRHSNMILNPWDWDDMPAAYDDGMFNTSVAESRGDDLWAPVLTEAVPKAAPKAAPKELVDDLWTM